MFGRRRREHFAVFVADERLGTAGADVDAEQMSHVELRLRRGSICKAAHVARAVQPVLARLEHGLAARATGSTVAARMRELQTSRGVVVVRTTRESDAAALLALRLEGL